MKGIGRKVKILLVDDKIENLIALEKTLAPLNLEIFKSTSGNDALKLMLLHDFAVVLLDVMMPIMDGIEVAKLVRQHEDTKHLPIIFITAMNKTESNYLHGMEAGAVDYLYKPIDPIVVLSKVRIFVDLYTVKANLMQHLQALNDINRFQKTLLESATYAIISWDENGIIKTFNKSAEKMLGYKAEEVIDKSTPLIFHEPYELEKKAQTLSIELNTKIEPNIEALIAKARQLGSDSQEWIFIRKDGTRLPVQLSINILRDETGAINGTLGMAFDISERKKIELIKNETISMVSHELRSPLTAILGAITLLTSGKVTKINKSGEQLLKIAQQNCERLMRLISNILDIEKIESGNMELKIETIELAGLVIEAIDAMQPYSDQYNVKLSFTKPIANLKVKSDRDKLLQVLTNLLSNAIKYSPPNDEISIEMNLLPNNIVRVCVSDKGKGIPIEYQSRIFQKFSQAPTEETKKLVGTGLGLCISKEIVEKLGGQINFKTELNKGTTFYFELPVEKSNVTVGATS